MSLSNLFNFTTSLGAIFLIILAISIFISSYSQNPNLKKYTNFFAQKANLLIMGASFLAIVGSLIYSEIFKFEPCVLCWWQRIFIYPIFFISLVALIKKQKSSFQYINPLIWIALLFSLYHNYLILNTQTESQVFCEPGTAGACTESYVNIFAGIDIPFMALSVILFILVLSSTAGSRNYQNKNESK